MTQFLHIHNAPASQNGAYYFRCPDYLLAKLKKGVPVRVCRQLDARVGIFSGENVPHTVPIHTTQAEFEPVMTVKGILLGVDIVHTPTPLFQGLDQYVFQKVPMYRSAGGVIQGNRYVEF